MTRLKDKLRAIIDVTFEMTAIYKEVILLCYSGLAYHHSFPRFREQVSYAEEQGEIIVRYDIPYMVRMLINMVEVTAENAHFVDIPQGSSTSDIQRIKDTLLHALERSLGIID